MKRRNFLASLTAAGIIAASKPTRVHAEPQVSRFSKQDLNGLLDVTEVPGIAISGMVRGQPVLQVEGFRVAPRPSGESIGIPIAPDTYFPTASLTKPVFAWAVVISSGRGSWS